MRLQSLQLSGFKSFANATTLEFSAPITAIVGPNGSGKSNIAEAFRFVLGEQSMKSMRGGRGDDLIFGGSQQLSRANRASVTLTLDNRNRQIDIDYDEVRLQRTVHRDGANEYKINGSKVRLRDVQEKLAGANVGASGHHIISQGEADRILAAHPRQRREMIEDALGLKAYQFKKTESEKKLAQTRDNIERVRSMRREIEPHLRFLQKQVEKIRRARELKTELAEAYREYFSREEQYTQYWQQELARQRQEPEQELERLQRELTAAREQLAQSDGAEDVHQQLGDLQQQITGAQQQRDEQQRALGRIEGEISAFERQMDEPEDSGHSIAYSDAAAVVSDVEARVAEGEVAEDLDTARRALAAIRERLRTLLPTDQSTQHTQDAQERRNAQYEQLRRQREEVQTKIQQADEQVRTLTQQYEQLQQQAAQRQEAGREAEREVYRITSRQNELQHHLDALQRSQQDVATAAEDLKQDLQEAVSLVGAAVREYAEHTPTDEHGAELSYEAIVQEERRHQRERRRQIEKMKAKLEEAGGGSGEEIEREYKQVQERDAYLAQELDDLEATAEKLVSIISDLESQLNSQFKDGLEHINRQFQAFFETLFGGGSAQLQLVTLPQRGKATTEEAGEDADDNASTSAATYAQAADETPAEPDEGIDVSISIPRKRIKGLQALSGGERSLVSIALIFAMSQVHPPPFIILDETDAALDEANARTYGQMVQRLSEHSQLILITHNRETMSHAGALYGITMGGDAASRVLSIQFEEAAKTAAR